MNLTVRAYDPGQLKMRYEETHHDHADLLEKILSAEDLSSVKPLSINLLDALISYVIHSKVIYAYPKERYCNLKFFDVLITLCRFAEKHVMFSQEHVINIFLAHLKVLRKEELDIHAVLYSRITPLHLAARSGCAILCEVLVKLGANIEAQADKNETPLHYACKREYVDAARALIVLGANVHALTKDHSTPMIEGAGCPDIVQLLYDNGADINAVGMSENIPTALYKAVNSLQLDAVQNMFRLKPYVNEIDYKLLRQKMAEKIITIYHRFRQKRELFNLSHVDVVSNISNCINMLTAINKNQFGFYFIERNDICLTILNKKMKVENIVSFDKHLKKIKKIAKEAMGAGQEAYGPDYWKKVTSALFDEVDHLYREFTVPDLDCNESVKSP